MSPAAQRLIFTDRLAAAKRAAFDFVYRWWWVPCSVLLLAVWRFA